MKFSVAVRDHTQTLVKVNDFDIPGNQINFLFGESGIGKSVFARSIFGLLDGKLLDIEVNGMTYEQYTRSEACQSLLKDGFFVFQEPSTHLNPVRPITDQLSEGILAYTKDNFSFLKTLWKKESAHVLQDILPLYPLPHRPSGGEKQRILLGMAFKKLFYLSKQARSPSLFVFDEPTGSLDDDYRNLFLEQLFSVHRQNPFTVLFITHDYSIITRILNHHASSLSHIHYHEAERSDSHTIISKFSQQDYLDWLKTLRTPAPNIETDRELLLIVESSIRLFNRQMRIKREHDTDLKVSKGQMIYLKAESGTGKTSLAKAIMGLIGADYLRMSLCGRSFTEKTPVSEWRRFIWGRRAVMVFQHADEALNLKAPVRGIFDGLPKKFRLSDSEILKKIQELFDQPIKSDFLDRKVGTLSGGQKQRLNLLRALLPSPDLLILDEPFNGLDLSSLKKIIPLLLEKQKTGTGILLISHNEEIIEQLIPESDHYYLKTE